MNIVKNCDKSKDSLNIVLIGFMGTGKTTTGKTLSQYLKMPFADIDCEIEKRIGMSIQEVFEKYGEPFFRNLEKQVVEELSKLHNMIIVCGGGIVLNKENIINLRKNGVLILLRADAKTILDRVKGDDSRPILKNNMSEDGIKDLLTKRNKYYVEAADITIDTDHKAPEKICEEIIMNLQQFINRF